MTDLKEIYALIKNVIRWAFKVMDRVQQNNHFEGEITVGSLLNIHAFIS